MRDMFLFHHLSDDVETQVTPEKETKKVEDTVERSTS